MTDKSTEIGIPIFQSVVKRQHMNGRRSSNWSRVAAQFPFVSLFSAETTGPISRKFYTI